MSQTTCLGCFNEQTVREWKKSLKANAAGDSALYKFVKSIEHIHTKIDKRCVDQLFTYVDRYVAKLVKKKSPSEEKLWQKVLNLKESGHTLLHQFAIKGDLSGIRAMLQVGDILKRKSDSDKTASDYYKEQHHGKLKKHLLLHQMKQLDLNFKHTFKYENATYRFTDICYSNGFHHHQAPFALFEVEINGKSHVRFCWLSRSQGVWRITDKMFKKAHGHIGKSLLGEGAIALPIDVNLFLYRKLADSKTREVSKADYRVLADCVVEVTDKDPDEDSKYGAESFRLEDYSETELAESVSTKSRMCNNRHNPPKNPERNQFKSSKKFPDFEHPLKRSTIIGNGLYIEPLATVYLSRDQKVRYLFLEESDGAAFIATAECMNKLITKYGIRQKSAALDGLDFPLYEYESQCDQKFWSKHTYEGYRRTSKYLGRVPVMIAYQNARKA